jgi:hypothetical protein
MNKYLLYKVIRVYFLISIINWLKSQYKPIYNKMFIYRPTIKLDMDKYEKNKLFVFPEQLTHPLTSL